MAKKDDYKKQVERMREQPSKIKGNFGTRQPEFKQEKKREG